jgi:hypothetical protein
MPANSPSEVLENLGESHFGSSARILCISKRKSNGNFRARLHQSIGSLRRTVHI